MPIEGAIHLRSHNIPLIDFGKLAKTRQIRNWTTALITTPCNVITAPLNWRENEIISLDTENVRVYNNTCWWPYIQENAITDNHRIQDHKRIPLCKPYRRHVQNVLKMSKKCQTCSMSLPYLESSWEIYSFKYKHAWYWFSISWDRHIKRYGELKWCAYRKLMAAHRVINLRPTAPHNLLFFLRHICLWLQTMLSSLYNNYLMLSVQICFVKVCGSTKRDEVFVRI